MFWICWTKVTFTPSPVINVAEDCPPSLTVSEESDQRKYLSLFQAWLRFWVWQSGHQTLISGWGNDTHYKTFAKQTMVFIKAIWLLPSHLFTALVKRTLLRSFYFAMTTYQTESDLRSELLSTFLGCHVPFPDELLSVWLTAPTPRSGGTHLLWLAGHPAGSAHSGSLPAGACLLEQRQARPALGAVCGFITEFMGENDIVNVARPFPL